MRHVHPALLLALTCSRHEPLTMMAKSRGKGKQLPNKSPPADVLKEKWRHFDEAEVMCRSGAGGHGAVISLPKRGAGPRLRRTADDDFELPPGGGNGGHVYLFVDPSCGDLLHLRGRPTLAAMGGGDSLGVRDMAAARERWREMCDDEANGGSRAFNAPGTLSSVPLRDGEPLRVPVPPGTFVRTTSGRVLGDLVAPGAELRVAVGGEGGPCVLRDERPQKKQKQKRRPDEDEFGFDGNDEDPFAMSEDDLRAITRGKPAEELRLSLVMRTVADVGFVGFPNAGKSTLLAALSRASPEVAPFPFTTLMPNLGAMVSETAADGASSTGDSPPTAAELSAARRGRTPPTVLADLPGLVEGAHAGKGLGRLFLRHLRRVRIMLYVLDTSCDDPEPTQQYDALRRELQLYNPQYLDRPHIVALNKLDLPLAEGGEAALAEARKTASRAIAASANLALNVTAAPVAIVPISGLKGKGLKILKEQIEGALAKSREMEADKEE